MPWGTARYAVLLLGLLLASAPVQADEALDPSRMLEDAVKAAVKAAADADAATLVEAILKALARGKREITCPRFMALAYVVRAMAPGFFRRQVRRQTLGATDKR